VAIQSDGKIVVSASIASSSGSDVLLLRYNPDGTRDLTFGAAGAATVNVGEGYDNVMGMAIQRDDKIVVTGKALNGTTLSADAFVLRCDRDGAIDPSFGAAGVVFFDATDRWPSGGSADWGAKIALQEDGKIVIAGYGTGIGVRPGYYVFLVRYKSDGSLDDSFGAGGVIGDHRFSSFYPTGSMTHGIGLALAIQADGSILFASNGSNGRDEDLLLTKYTSDGIQDGLFGKGGALVFNSEGGPVSTLGRAIVVQPDGKVVVAGSTTTGTGIDAIVIRYNADGTLDGDFGEGGYARYNGTHHQHDEGFGLALQPDGKILVTGHTNSPLPDNPHDFLLLRLNADGTPDATFGTGGAVILFGAYVGTSVLVLPDGKILAAGFRHGGSWEGVVYKFNADGSLDSGFGVNGEYRDDSPYMTTFFEAAAVQPDGKIVLAGSSQGDWTLLVVRLNANGTLDSTFGSNGSFRYSRDNFYIDAGMSLVLQEDGKIVVGGDSRDSSWSAALLLRLKTDGTLDGTFGQGGISLFGMTQYDFGAHWHSIAQQPDGKIVCFGDSENHGPVVARYWADGTLDTTFGIEGLVRLPVTFGAYGVALQGDGKIVFTGVGLTPDGVPRAVAGRLMGGSVEPPPPPPPPVSVNPDLTGEWVSLTQVCKNSTKGERCKIKGTLNIRNIGTVDALSSSMKFYLSGDEKYDEDADEFVKQMATGKVKAGKSKRKRLNYSYRRTAPASHKYLLAVIDADNTVDEIDESNNIPASGPLQ
jgi:uncharacterized delta-60 repeat protein